MSAETCVMRGNGLERVSLEDLNTPLAIVIPVQNAERLLRECLSALLGQLRAEDLLVVVDDSSEDGTAGVAEGLGATVIRRQTAGGPYAARNDGWRATTQPYVLFTDARCIAHENLLDRVREAASHGPDLIFGEMTVRSGPRVAERVAAERQHLRVAPYAADSFLPYFPTACLTVRREALEAADGFRIVDSGGDADLCWRVQLAGMREITQITDPVMEWRPRATVLSLLRQWAKYGRSTAWLRHEFRLHGATAPAPRPATRILAGYTIRLLRRIAERRARDLRLTVVTTLADAACDLSYARSMRALRKG